MAKRASVVIALFSFVVAPLLQFAPEGLWQIIRIFTGFYNIPIIVIVIVGLFTRRVPALAAKCVIVFHVVAYALLKFALADVVTLHFIHLYAVLFVVECAMMLLIGRWRPRRDAWTYAVSNKVDLTPWRFARPVAVLLISCVVLIYVVFSPVGLAGDHPGRAIGATFIALFFLNLVFWWRSSPAGPRTGSG